MIIENQGKEIRRQLIEILGILVPPPHTFDFCQLSPGFPTKISFMSCSDLIDLMGLVHLNSACGSFDSTHFKTVCLLLEFFAFWLHGLVAQTFGACKLFVSKVFLIGSANLIFCF